MQELSDRGHKLIQSNTDSLDESLSRELHSAEHRLGSSSCLSYLLCDKDLENTVMIISA